METKVNLTTRRHKGRQGKTPRLIVIHTMEAPEGPQTAENIANYFKRVDASSHWCHDNNSRVRVVNDEDTAWTAPGANNDGLQIELAGYAKQTAADWADAYSLDMLEGAAQSAAEWVVKYGIPIRRLSVAEVKAGHKGFCGHDEVSKAYKRSTHWDPGPAFPWDYFLGRVAAKLGQAAPPPSSVSPGQQASNPGYSNAGFTASHIKATQEKLNKLGYGLELDGRRGPKTLAAIKDFQSKNGLESDGLPGPKTQAKLDAAISGKGGGSSEVKFSVDYIKDIQNKLNKVGYALDVDGSRGPKTQTAVKDFQKKQGLVVDGLPGPQTKARLDAVSSTVPVRNPKRPNVTGLQAAVRANQDNSWGPDTDKRLEAVRAASAWAGQKFPHGVKFAQQVVGTNADGDWGRNSVRAHDISVSAIQAALLQMGYNPGRIDGKWGPSTEAAYQSARAAAKVG